jgi:surface antigen
VEGRRTIIRNQQDVIGNTNTSTAQLKQQVFARPAARKKSLGMPKSTTIAAYTGVFLLVMSMVAIGYQPPQRIDTVANAAETSAPAQATQPSVDQIVATNVAAGIAERAELSVAPNVANLSLSLTAEGQLAQNDTNTIIKPQIIQPSADSREIKSYAAKAGDSVTKIAQQFGLSPDTIKWANNLNSDAVEAGRNMVIPPIDGIIYAVKDGDTVDSIASKYSADKDRIVAFNDLELGGLAGGRKIIIPAGSLPENERPGYVDPRSSRSSGVYGGVSMISSQLARASAGNRYAPGNCTFYAYERRMQLGRPIGSFWGNASSWAISARSAGFTVDRNPEVGAIAQWNAYQGGSYGAGHVGVVESVNSDGSITISEMNYLGNYGRTTGRTISPGSVSNFIH